MHDHTGGTARQNRGAFYRVEGNGDWLIDQLINCLIDWGQIQERQTYHLDGIDWRVVASKPTGMGTHAHTSSLQLSAQQSPLVWVE